MEKTLRNFRRERSGSPSRILLVIFTILVITAAVTGSTFAANGDPVDTIANPAGTTITFFDYWIYANGVSTSALNLTGINENHDLHFRTGSDTADWNQWTGAGGGALQGILKPVLGEDGYPILAVGSEESLAYLFDPNPLDYDYNGTALPAKRVYPTSFMFSVSDDGHYMFNSEIHNAVMNRDTNELTVTEQTNGYFFPFNNGQMPTSANPDGWFFGVHINTEFSIPYDGMVLNPSGNYQEMVFDFTGDDDVWVFIDGILIGDAGGIHDEQDLHINFTTGDVNVYNHANHNHEHPTTIYQMIVDAIGEEEALSRFAWKEEEDGTYKTFGGNTYHTLDFFYLERGANISNMEMSYNLVSTYHFSGHKSLYRTNDSDETVLQ